MRTSSSAYAPATPLRTVHELLHRGTGHHCLRDRFAARVVPPVRLGPGCSAVLVPLLVKSSLTILHARVGHYNPAAGPSTSHARIHHHRVLSRRSLLFLTVPSCCTAVASRAPRRALYCTVRLKALDGVHAPLPRQTGSVLLSLASSPSCRFSFGMTHCAVGREQWALPLH
jgi:hypothetical protein